ncbi:chloride channel [Gautieria morchelliformis]|nr:chloride channel [Gautieria morchelliformis]
MSATPAASNPPKHHGEFEQRLAVPFQRSVSHPAFLEDHLPVSEHGSYTESQPVTMPPLIAPMSPHTRRERLLRIGTSSSTDRASQNRMSQPNPSTFLSSSTGDLNFYGSISSPARQRLHVRRRTWGPISVLPFRRSSSTPPSPHYARSRSSVFFLNPAAAYDAPVEGEFMADHAEDSEAAKANGIRVWYSSFSSIDWLHDAIKDSNRIFRLRKRKSLRGRILNAVDRSLGWIVVTIVGFVTAVLAFLIVRSEEWLFDIKGGHCTQGWWRSRTQCCSSTTESPMDRLDHAQEACKAWQPWDVLFEGSRMSDIGLEGWAVEYGSYTIIALLLALSSVFLTIKLTASTSFVGWKDSGVLSPSFSQEDEDQTMPPGTAPIEPKRKVMYFAAGSGIPEVKTILSGFVIHGYLGGRTLVTKCIGLPLAVASGLSLGKEGPLVHIAACVGNIVSRYFVKYETNEGKRREILSAASAAGVAVAFGAPIGGVLFSLEEVSYFFPAKVMWRSFFCAMIAAVTLRLLDPFGTGKLVLFQVTYDKDWHAFELVLFVVIGVFGGVYGAYFSKMNHWWTKNVRGQTWLRTHPASEVLLVTLVTTVLGFLNPYVRLSGTELVYNLFAECREGDSHAGLCPKHPDDVGPLIRAIGIAMIVKGLLTIVTFGIRLPAGIFVPSLGVGACFGRIVGLATQYWQWKHPDSDIFRSCHGDQNCMVPGVYAMIGAAAALSGVTRTTVSLAVIMFELTDTLTYVVPVMVGILVARTVADALEPKGIYDICIELSQLPYLDGKSEHLWGGLQAGDAIVRHVEAICLDRTNTVRSLRDQLQAVVSAGGADAGFPILSKEPGGLKVIGYIGVNELEYALTVVADDADAICHFHPARGAVRDTASFESSYREYASGPDPFDFTVYMNHAPLSVSTYAPLELVQQFFVKLGARYVIVTSDAGFFEGVIDKKQWVAFLAELDHKIGS